MLLEARRVIECPQAHVVAGAGNGYLCIGYPPGRICNPASPGFDRRFLLWHLRTNRPRLGAKLAEG